MASPSLDTELRQTALPDQEQKSGQQIQVWPRRSPLSPGLMAIVLALAVFVCEASVMLLLYYLPPVSPVLEAIFDSSALVLSLLPVYLLLYKPFWSEHQQFSKEVSSLSRKLMKSAEDERKRVSHDLHDQCGQTLTALQFRTEALRRCITKEECDLQGQVEEMSKLISQLTDELREVTYRLRPETLEKLGLVSAMENLTADFKAIQPEVQVVENYSLAERIHSGLSEAAELALFRICQECLHNISKYAEAKLVTITLEPQRKYVLLEVRDDGKGFIVRRCHGGRRKGRQGFGLLGIRERVADLGGRFDLATQLGNGTCVRVLIPIESEGA